MTTINTHIANILGMKVPDEILERGIVEPIKPHELVILENPDLPPLNDLEIKQLGAESELQIIIDSSLSYQENLFTEANDVEPHLRNRYIEVANGTLSIALDAIKAKMKSLDDRRKNRLKEASYTKPNSTGAQSTMPKDVFMGSREELMAILNNEVDKTA